MPGKLILDVFIAGEAIAQPRPRACKRGTVVTMVSALSGHKVNGWKDALRFTVQFKMEGRGPVTCPVRMEALFLMKRPKALLKKSTVAVPTLHTKKPDLDNLLKAILDACNLIVFDDDCQVSTVVMKKRYADAIKDEMPGVRVRFLEDELQSRRTT